MSKICFIVGHGKSKGGGYDPGACSGSFQEFKIAREIAKYAQEYLNANYSEQCDLMNYNGDLYLTDRIKKVNANTYDFIAEFHLNAGKGIGTECFYYHDSPTGKKVAQAITANISAALGIRDRGAKIRVENGKDYFAIIRDTKPCATLIETAFIDSADVDKVKTAAGQKSCGEAVAKAVASALGLKKKATTQPTATPPGKLYRVQVGAFSKRENAEDLLKKLKAAGFDALITE